MRWPIVFVVLLMTASLVHGATSPAIDSSSSTPIEIEAVPTRKTTLRVLASDRTGVTLAYRFPSPRVERVPDSAYIRVVIDDALPTGRPGEPELPAHRVMIGAPPGTEIRVHATPGPSKEIGRGRIAPVPTARIVSDPGGIERAKPRYVEDRSVYSGSDPYPSELARIVLDGMMRDRRIVQLEVRPIQYEPRTGQIRAFTTMTVRVDFVDTVGAPSWNVSSPTTPESPDFAGLFVRNVVNDAESRTWRVPRAPAAAAPAKAADATIAAVKFYISKRGVYRVTGKMLSDYFLELGVDLRAIDPRNLRMTFKGREIPVYVDVGPDGRFDADDYVEFLAERPTNLYSIYSVYWLILGDRPGLRVAEAEGAPRNSLATLVPAFRSKVYFEENKLFSLLQHVPPEVASPGDPHHWYEARDHWFYFGIKNRSDRNEGVLKFSLFDAAKTFDRVRFRAMLQGGTPVEHDIIASLNEVKLARARWKDQDEFPIQISLPPDAIVDATQGQNVFRLVRVDTNEDDDTDNYPYHAYVNWFEVEYTRLFKAVNDELFMSTPPFTDPPEVRRRRMLEYDVSDFLSPDVAVYEQNGKELVTRFRNIEVEPVPTTPEMRERLVAIEKTLGIPIEVPDVLYEARFQVPDDHEAQYVVVSSRGARVPDRIEPDYPSDLRNPANGADHITIYSPPFKAAAERLAEWRRTKKGGGYRAMAIDVTDIYDEYGDGMVSPWAIKAFLTDAFEHWQGPPLTHVVILADGTYDLYGVDKKLYPEPPDVMGYIPTHYVWTLFGLTASDHWYTTVSGIDVLADFFLGRLSVETEEQAEAVVDKIIGYEGNPPNGSWRRKIISVADDDTTNSGDFLFRKSLTEISQNHTLLGYTTDKIFLEDIIDEVNANPERFQNRRPAAVTRERIVDSMSDGAILAQYAGHGGRLVWAHEIIFDNPGIRTLRPTRKLPLMFVLSCNNGYFDAPADPSMAEAMLRLPQAGIIGMVAATRLTFGAGNDALNKLIFDEIFQHNVRGFGEIAFIPKTRLMLEQGLTHLEVMQQYSLFGDPATRLYMANNEIRPVVLNRSVEPGGTLRIAAGDILRSEYIREEDRKRFTPVPDFNGKLFVTSQFTERGTGFVVERVVEVAVTNGRYPEITLDIPPKAKAGRAQVEFYAESEDSLAVGGATFAISEPVIEEIAVTERPNRTIAIATKVTDDREIVRVEVEWFDHGSREWKVTPMEADPTRGAGWYSVPIEIASPPIGKDFEYSIRVTDSDGVVVESDSESYVPHPLPDWTIAYTPLDNEPRIAYDFDPARGWHLAVWIENQKDVRTEVPVPVAFYLGNPDLDQDRKPDPSAHLLGTVTIKPSDWTKGDPLGPNPNANTRMRDPTTTPLNEHWRAKGVLPIELDPGRYALFAWVDPPTGTAPDPPREMRTRNNLGGRVVDVATVRVANSAGRVISLDGSFRADLSAKAFTEPRIVRAEPIASPPTGQASLTALPALASGRAYRLRAEAEPENATLGSPATIEYIVDLTAFRTGLQERAGLGDRPYDQLTDDEKALLDEVTRTEIAGARLYVWRPKIERWRRVADSGVLRDGTGALVTRGAFMLPEWASYAQDATPIYIDRDNVQSGDWVVFFTGSFQYDLYYAPDGQPLERVAVGMTPVSDERYIPAEQSQFPFVGSSGEDTTWRYGDLVIFRVNPDGAGGKPAVQAVHRGNDGNGVVQRLTVDTNRAKELPEDRWYVLFLDRERYLVRRESVGTVTSNGSPIIGRIGEEWYDPATGVRLVVLAGRRRFSAGDSFHFESRTVGILRAQTTELGTFAPFLSSDETPPIVTVTVAGQDFADGDPVPPKPELRIALTDDSGLDPEDVTLELSRDGADFAPIPPDAQRDNFMPGTRQLLINVTPELEPGDYLLRTTAFDLDENRTIKEIAFRVTTSSQLRSVLNYPNPFRTYTDFAIDATGEMDELTIAIYSVQGRLVRRLEHPPTAGFVRIRWDGRDTDGRRVANGVYYGKVTMKARGRTQTDVIKLLKLK